MKIKTEQLKQALERQLLPIYLVLGDEPLQVRESCQAVLDKAKACGFDEREVLDASAGFDWQQLAFYASAGSLFSQKRLLDLRIDNGKPGKDGAAALQQYLEQGCCSDNLLLIRLPFLNWKAMQAKWFKNIEKKAGVIQIWPVNAAQAPGWIQQRAQGKGLRLEREATHLIAETTEGNLLAADQLLERMLLDFGQGAVSMERVLGLLSDDAQFDVGNLIKYILLGNVRRVVQVWQNLKAMNEPQPLVLWMLADMLRNLVTLAEHGMSEGLRRKIRSELVSAYEQAARRHDVGVLHGFLQRLTGIDQAVKGLRSGDSWYALLQLSLSVSSRQIVNMRDVISLRRL